MKKEGAKGSIAVVIDGFLQKRHTKSQGQAITLMLNTMNSRSRHGDINVEKRMTTCRTETTL